MGKECARLGKRTGIEAARGFRGWRVLDPATRLRWQGKLSLISDQSPESKVQSRTS